MNNLVEIKNNQVITSSRKVAEVFGKNHYDVLESIENITKTENSVLAFFHKTTYQVPGNFKEYPEYLMNRDGFSLLVMGFTGKKALQWKLKYIEEFNKMEKTLLQQAKPIVTLYDGKLYARFSDVAAFFGETIEAICNIADDYSRVGFSDYFQYPNSEYFMTKDGLALVMKDKSKVKEYVKAFEEMEHQLELIKPKYMELPPIEIANNRPGRMRRKKVGMEILTCVMAVLEANRASMIQK